MSAPSVTDVPRPDFPPRALEIVNSFEGAHVRGNPKGASRTARMITEVLCIMAEDTPGERVGDAAAAVKQAAGYFTATRGQMTPAIGNTIGLMLAGMEEASGSLKALRAFLRGRAERFNRDSLAHVEAIREIGANLFSAGMTVLVYDYSSTVVGILTCAGQHDRVLNLVIPESRALNGGIPIVRAAAEAGHRVIYTTDSAIGHELSQADAALIGAESLTAMGGCWNTMGSKMVAVMARYHGVPLYVPTELLKFDRRSTAGILRQPRRIDVPVIAGNDPVLQHSAVEVSCQDLDYVPPEFVNAYITEVGILPPHAMVSAALKRFEDVPG